MKEQAREKKCEWGSQYNTYYYIPLVILLACISSFKIKNTQWIINSMELYVKANIEKDKRK